MVVIKLARKFSLFLNNFFSNIGSQSFLLHADRRHKVEMRTEYI